MVQMVATGVGNVVGASDSHRNAIAVEGHTCSRHFHIRSHGLSPCRRCALRRSFRLLLRKVIYLFIIIIIFFLFEFISMFVFMLRDFVRLNGLFFGGFFFALFVQRPRKEVWLVGLVLAVCQCLNRVSRVTLVSFAFQISCLFVMY